MLFQCVPAQHACCECFICVSVGTIYLIFAYLPMPHREIVHNWGQYANTMTGDTSLDVVTNYTWYV